MYVHVHVRLAETDEMEHYYWVIHPVGSPYDLAYGMRNCKYVWYVQTNVKEIGDSAVF